MANRLFGEVVFGPVKSRRLGMSLGINIIPADAKICSFNCIYCECGWNTTEKPRKFVPREIILAEMAKSFRDISLSDVKPDVITFAGNGEPTLHPDFGGVINDTLSLRDKYLSGVPVAVLSNSTMLYKKEVREALLRIDLPILKLDSASPELLRIINNVTKAFDYDKYIDGLLMMKGRAIIQTMFIKGTAGGVEFDNSSDNEVNALSDILVKLEPKEVQIYTLHRVPPTSTVSRIENERLKEIKTIFEKASLKVHLVLN